MSIEELVEQFPASCEQLEVALEFAARSLDAPVGRPHMFILLDNPAQRGVAVLLRGRVVKRGRSPGWDELKNGDSLDVREVSGFKVLLTTDKNIRHQQNLPRRELALVLLGKGRSELIRPMPSEAAAAANTATPGSFTEPVIPEH
jgi:hypothetical protein